MIQDANTFLATSPLVANLIATYAPQGAVGAKLVQVSTGNTITNPAAADERQRIAHADGSQSILPKHINEVVNDTQFNATPSPII